MKKTLLPFLLLMTVCGCNKLILSGNIVSEDFSLAPYTELEVSHAFDVTVSEDVTRMTITTDEVIMPYVVVEMTGGKLRIRLKPLASSYGAELKVSLPYNPDLNDVTLSGASDFHTSIPLNARTVRLNLSGASDFYGDIVADELDMHLSGASRYYGSVAVADFDLDLSGASDAYIEGGTGTLALGLSGASTLKEKKSGSRYAFSCDTCEGSLSGASDAFIHCDGSIKVSLSGASVLRYTGIASTTGTHTSGGASIHHDVF